jgi:cysteine desulfurase
VVEAMLPYFSEHFGNAASRHHAFGWRAEAAVEYAREQVANLIGAEPKEIVFTSGATEADNLAIKGACEMYTSKGNHIITCAIEHKAVLDTCKHLEKLGIEVSYLPVLPNGSIDLKDLEAAIRPGTILISIMYANNEIGTIMPVKAISELARKHGILFFTDATQAVGKIPVDVNKDQIDLLALTAHKMYGPKGVGALYVRRRDPRVRLASQMDGGGHERGMRSGTLNVPGIVGLGKAAELAQLEMQEESNRLRKMRDHLEHGLLLLDQTFVNGDTENRLPHMTNISFQHVEGEALLMGINKEIAISSGSACTSASIEPSYVLKALGLSDELAHSSLRFGLGRNTTEEEIIYTIEKVSGVVNNLREMSPLWENRNSR